MNLESTVVGRLAPSPTGAQHLGNARTYLIAWLSARSQGGRIGLRIEDIDKARVRPGAAERICDDLRWLGLTWEGDPVYQTDRLSYHQEALERLKTQELVYPCTCTRSEIARATSAPHAEHEGMIYPGTCGNRCAADARTITDRPFAWRLRTRHDTIRFDDRFRGPISLNLRDIGGDFVVWTSTGAPAYQLAVVVDDAAQGVTEIIRGDDLIPSTPRQIALYRALGLTPPSFAHVPLVVGPDGRRLAKRNGDSHLPSLREAGVKPEELLGLLAWSCGLIERIEPACVEDLLDCFELAKLPDKPFVLTPGLLARIGFPRES
jgi:glutamyl-tRNA synthetase